MDLGKILGQATVLENFLNGGVREYRTVVLSVGEERLVLPVTPWKYSVTTRQNNKIVDILDFGEALIFGTTALKNLKLSCFFPALKHQYPFVVGDNSREPSECVDLLTNWKEGKKPVRVIITDSPVNLQMAIQKFGYNEKDGSRDIYYSIDFEEYRDLNVIPANYNRQIDNQTGLKYRPTGDGLESIQSKLVNNALDLLDKSKAAYGDFSSLGKFQSKNGLSGLSLGGIKIGGWSW